ncbi:Hsp20/alpha crystallin family protein [Kutzneria sp. 744]|uniref:Hsp20/alpha crystallin family protein n=1 Tax=Kutzneria sp. (strain 744) TaxID=345341 RepID=UPI0003EEB634|nr:Hsp20/alpha crystallin family protein [Kutzneria sp. 744]EWM19144.1 heat shock protein, HSP20 family [Kutzneria sp. 744]
MTLPVGRSAHMLGRWDPFREFEDIYGQLGRWLDAAAGRIDERLRTWTPLADVSETAEEYLVEVDLPGVARDDVAIDLVGNELVIDGEIKDREREGVFRQRARRAGRFTFRVLLPQDVDEDHIEANLADGVLNVRAPKTEQAKARRIAISSD